MKVKYFKVEKLIRDRMLPKLKSIGIEIHGRNLDTQDFIFKLKEKLLEEAKEVTDCVSKDQLIEELADVLEVVQSLSKASEITMQQIEEKRIEKYKEKGGFEDKFYNTFASVEENNPAIKYYLNDPEKYPQMISKEHKSDCLFCQMAKQERKVSFYAKFDHCFVIKDEFPVSTGHILIIPNDHTENWFTAREEVRLEMMKVLHLMKVQLDLECNPSGYNLGANCGVAAGQSVMHLHFHLIPRYHGDMENPKGGIRGVIPSKQKY